MSNNTALPIRHPIKIWKIVLIPVVMFGFAFSLVPLYDVFCDLTGFNGKSSRLTEVDNSSTESLTPALNHKIQTTFVTSVAPGLPMVFYPKKNTLEVVAGKIYQMTFIAENRSDKAIVGQAIPSVSPPQAAIHFRKMECFCFQQQQLAAHAKVEMPVRFVIDPALNEEIKNISLAYTFYLKENKKGNAKTTVSTHNEDFSTINSYHY